MIDGFYLQTHPLTEEEKKVILPFCNGLKTHVGKLNAITSDEMIRGIRKNCNVELTGPRVRKIISHIRQNDLVPRLVANSKGYYIEPNDEELLKYINSLKQRADAILEITTALRRQMDPTQNKLKL